MTNFPMYGFFRLKSNWTVRALYHRSIFETTGCRTSAFLDFSGCTRTTTIFALLRILTKLKRIMRRKKWYDYGLGTFSRLVDRRLCVVRRSYAFLVLDFLSAEFSKIGAVKVIRLYSVNRGLTSSIGWCNDFKNCGFAVENCSIEDVFPSAPRFWRFYGEKNYKRL